MTTKPPLQKILKGILYKKMKTNITMKGQKVLNLIRRKDKHSESSIESAAYTQVLKQQKQLNGRNHHIPLHTNTECLLIDVTSPSKDTIWQTGLKRKTQQSVI
jgi:hypothetical protein